MGSLSLTTRPAWETNLVMMVSSSCWLSKWFSSFCRRPAFSTKMLSNPFIITSVMSVSAMICPSTPRPRMDSYTASAMRCRSRKFREDSSR